MRRSSDLSLEAGTSTFWWRERMALRIRVRKSATGSVNLIFLLLLKSSPVCSAQRRTRGDGLCELGNCVIAQLKIDAPPITRLPDHSIPFHHDDFETPGISPRSASPRKHKRQMPNLRR